MNGAAALLLVRQRQIRAPDELVDQPLLVGFRSQRRMRPSAAQRCPSVIRSSASARTASSRSSTSSVRQHRASIAASAGDSSYTRVTWRQNPRPPGPSDPGARRPDMSPIVTGPSKPDSHRRDTFLAFERRHAFAQVRGYMRYVVASLLPVMPCAWPTALRSARSPSKTAMPTPASSAYLSRSPEPT